ncbi:MraY family glycosyltransferase [Pseudomonas nunensis]|uniref:Glycosyltransferase family 4 protein n=1 Tax=Pseudomonas nunensis TaxID=2961896 RepID=A0ABY5EJZ9_9PSED|nr:glycosyltransferase family 4 protein [Pseudomonas nunensis]KPN94027.1 glycosyl transferase [Pseudomonas nunensis]MCL5230531.1 glycosyltransferase family 4 protein [Pseudomonas nunensis]UTO15548.1 glycosyltransferase family 4 protein [Pseudomonas nunensis]
MILCWLILALAGLSYALTAILRRYALSRSLLDIPNNRSSHSVPTPRGGGVAIVLTFLLALAVLFSEGLIPASIFFALAGAGALTAIIGFLDDHGHIAARWRLLAHFLAAIWGVYWLGGLPALSVYGVSINLGWFGHLLAVIYLVWMLNLYNFMDGIDGIAGVEAVTICLGGCLLYWAGHSADQAWPAVLLAACVAGFLCWNFPPAKIFMGDAGSGFLGVVIGVLSLQAGWISPDILWGWLILLGVFIVDATFTLLRRLLRGDKIYEAHRSHAYQFASRRFGKHLPVTLAVGLINLFWLLPVAFCMVYYKLDGATALVIAYVPLVLLALKYRAGQLEGVSSNN